MQIIITIANPSNYKIPVSIYSEFYTSVYYLVHLREPLPCLMARMYSICYTRLGINLQFYMYSCTFSFIYAFLLIIHSIAQIYMDGIIFYWTYFVKRTKQCLQPPTCHSMNICVYYFACITVWTLVCMALYTHMTCI